MELKKGTPLIASLVALEGCKLQAEWYGSSGADLDKKGRGQTNVTCYLLLLVACISL